MKRGFCLLFLLLIPGVLAESYNDASSLTLETDLKFELQPTEPVEELSADLTFFPRADERQKRLALDVSTFPVAEIEREEEKIVLYWNELDDFASFTIESKLENKVLYKEFPAQIPKSSLKEFTSPTSFINADNPKIRTLARDIAGKEENPLLIAYKLGLWTKENIEYNLSTLNAEASLSGINVLESGEGVCDEITILFLSFVRSLDIPARYVSGIVYSESFEDLWVPHAWAEVYLNGEWVPFDITLGQLGWIDPTHIKTKVSDDVDYSSIVYRWRSVSGDIETKELNISSTVLDSEFPSAEGIVLSVNPVFKEVYPGSFVPLEVELFNPSENYVFEQLTLKKGPGLFTKNSLPVLLAPKERKSEFFILEIPDDIGEEEYSTSIEIDDRLNNRFSTSLLFGKKHRKISADDALFYMKKIMKERQHDTLPTLRADCLPTKSSYEEGEIAIIECKLNNMGVKRLELVLCLEECKELVLEPGENKNIGFEYDVDAGLEPVFRISSDNLEKKIFSRLKVFSSPGLEIKEFSCPSKISDDERSEISLTLESKSLVKDAYLLVEGLEPFKLDDFEGSHSLSLPVRGRQFTDKRGYVIAYISYGDGLGNRFDTFDICDVEVDNTPPLRSFNAKVKNLLKFDIPFLLPRLSLF